MTQTIIIDTSVLIYDPMALNSFFNQRITIPFTVIEELEQMSKRRDEAGKNASQALNHIRLLLDHSKYHTSQGVRLHNGSELYIETLPIKNTVANEKRKQTSFYEFLRMIAQKEKVLFITKSLTRRVLAETLGIEVKNYENQCFSFSSLYKGYRWIKVEKEVIEHFYKDGSVAYTLDSPCRPNEYMFLSAGNTHHAVGKYCKYSSRIVALSGIPDKIWGIKPLNLEQKCAFDLLLRNDVQLVTLLGQAGSGKTMLALAAAMYQVLHLGSHNKLLISRPIVPMGKDIGFLPGLKEEKLLPWMQPIYDNMESLFEANGMGDFSEVLQSLMETKKIEMEVLTYIRGRSLPNIIMIIDEAQNLTPHEIKTIISRAGKGTKIILTGDPTQIDSLYFDENSNGLTYLVGKFQHLPLYGQMFMSRTERSELAAAAATIL